MTEAERLETEDGEAMLEFLRDLFGNPFRPTLLDDARLPPEVIETARDIYDDRAFDRLPSLADALEQAGCADEPCSTIAVKRGCGSEAAGSWT